MNGSDVNIGCQGEVSSIYGRPHGVMLCGHPQAPAISYLTDGITPDINISTGNWASQLVTVRKNAATPPNIPFDHVVLLFDTISAMNLASVELDMFICPQWNIGAPNISVYVDGSDNIGSEFNINDNRIQLYGTVTLQSFCVCNSLSTVRIPLQNAQPGAIWHIVVNFELNSAIEWVHIGEVRLLNESTNYSKCTAITSCTLFIIRQLSSVAYSCS